MYKTAVIGDRASVCGFAALGLEVYYAENEREVSGTIKRLIQDSYAVIYITEAAAALAGGQLTRLSQSILPAIIPIPGVYGNTGMGMKAVEASVIKAVGSDV